MTVNLNEDENPSNSIVALRNVLFNTLRDLNNPDKPADLDRAKAINEISQTIINSAKVEVEMVKVIGGSGSGFVPSTSKPVESPRGQALPFPGKRP